MTKLKDLTLEDFPAIEQATAATSQTYSLDLLQNALDSLDEGLTQLRAADAGRVRASKFAILHVSHYLELLLKHCVATSIDESAIWETDERRKTISAFTALKRLVAGGIKIPSSFKKDLDWFRDMRNDVEHYAFSLDGRKTRDTIERLLYDANLIVIACSISVDFVSALNSENVPTFAALSEEYEARLKVALAAVEEAEQQADWRSGKTVDVLECDSCGQNTFIPNDASPTGYRCLFCGEEHADNMEVHCDTCGVNWANWQMRTIEDFDGEGHSQTMCPRCLRDPEYVGDKD